MDRQRLIFSCCAILLVVANGFVWYHALNKSKVLIEEERYVRETGDTPESSEEQETTSDEELQASIDERIDVISREAPVEQRDSLKVAAYGNSFIWPHPATFTRVTTREFGLSEGFKLKDASGQVVAQGACGTYGYYEGPYASVYLGGEKRTFIRDGVEFTISYGEYEREMYVEGTGVLPPTGTPTEIIIELESAEAIEARKGVITWRSDACTLSTYGDAPITPGTRSALKEVYRSWR